MSASGSPGFDGRFSPFRVFSTVVAICAGLAVLVGSPATCAYAASIYTVTTNTDDYGGTPTTVTGTASHCPANGTATGCTLRDAVTAALGDPGSTIKFAVTGTNTLAFVLPAITVNTTIAGPGANALTISGGYQQFSVSGALTTVTVSGLTLANANNTVVGTGLMPSYAGAIYNLASTLTVDHVVFLNNTTGQPSLPGEGGAILNNTGSLTVNDCMFIGNSVQYSGVGGAITSVGTLKVSGSTFIGNASESGSAIYSLSGLSISDSTFTENDAAFSGAVTFTSGTVTVTNSTFVGNLAGFGPNEGTGIFNDGSPATLVVTNSILDVPTGGAACVTTSTPSDCPISGINGNIVAAVSALELAPLGYYGGPTETMLPLAGSPAHCAGASPSFPGTDQRGFAADLSCGAGLVDAGSVQTNYLTVTTAADDPTTSTATCGTTCTLRDAINAAMADGNGDIDFATGVNGGTIALGAALPTISTPGTIDVVGPGANLLTISGNNAYPILNIAEGTVDLGGLTIANGKTTGSGAGINNSGTLTLSHVVLSGNSAATDGGAIENSGAVLASDSTLSGNKATLGSAIYNTGSVGMTYSTVAGNAASTSGGIYNSSGAAMTAVNSTFAGNTGSAGAGIFNSGALTMSNSVLDTATECSGSGCPAASGGGNVVGASLSALGVYGGPTPTVLPEPGSSAICAGSAANLPLFVTTDQRGFANENTTYTGYSATASCVDAGAVQTNYTAVQFTGAGPYVATQNAPGTTPPLVVAVTENGQNIGGVAVTLTFSGTGTATGLTATTAAGTGATFSGLTVNTASASGDTLAVSLAVVGTDTLTAAPVALTVNPGSAAPTIIFTVPNHTYGDAPFIVAATSNSPGTITYSVVTGPATISGSTVTLTGAGMVELLASQGAATGYLAGSQTATFTVSPASQTITFTGLPAIATYGSAGPYTLNGSASSGLAVS